MLLYFVDAPNPLDTGRCIVATGMHRQKGSRPTVFLAVRGALFYPAEIWGTLVRGTDGVIGQRDVRAVLQRA